MGGRVPQVVLLIVVCVACVSRVAAQVGSVVVATQQQDWAGATLSFAIDTTGSMYDDLLQVRNGVQNIFRAISEQKEIPVLNYALVTFHDPDVNLATLTADQTTFENAVEASLEVHGGGDCPEMAIGGINLALRRSLPRSFIFVFTDASAKDYHLKGEALSLIQETQSQVIFVLTGDCNDQSGPGFQVFKDIAAASAGQIFFLRQKNEVSEVLKFIEISVNARQVNILSVETRPGRATYAIPVDSSLQQLIVSVSTNTSTGGNVRLPDIRLMSPSGREFIPSVDLGSVVVINITSPVQGWWNLLVDSPLPYSVRVKGVSLVDFKIHFTVASGTQRVFITRPVEGQPSFIVLQASNEAGFRLVTGMQLLNLAGVVLHDIPLNWNTSHPYPRIAHPGFEAPQQLFYVRVRGRDHQNMTFYRLTPTPVRPGQPSPPTVIDWLTDISGELGGSVQLRCDYRSLVQANVVWFRDGVPITTVSRNDPRFLVLADGKLRVSELSLDDANCYHCQVVSIAGNDTGRPVCLEVLQPPRITQPVAGTCNNSAVPGSSFQLQCRAVGDPTPTVRWEKDGVRIASTSRVRIFSNGLLRVRQARFSDNGRYTCLAENGVGTPDTRDCYTQLMTPPSYTHVQDATAIVGSTATLRCTADGSPAPQMTWWNGQDRIFNSTRITSLPSGQLIFHSVELNDEGPYTCVAANPAGRRSSTGFLTVHVPPQIVVAPNPLYVLSVNDEFRLLCVANGKPDASIDWLFNQGPVDRSRFNINRNTLSLSRLSVSDQGNYTCLATNEAGSDDSTAVLIVQVPPRVITTQSRVVVLEGNAAFLPCEVIGKPPPSLTWSKDRGTVDARFSSQQPGGLVISATVSAHSGLYTCTASNPAGQASHSVELVVEVAPSIEGPLDTDLVIFPNLYICMDCVATALPVPSLVWQRDSLGLPPANPNYVQHVNGTLCVRRTSVLDSGEYTCLVTNKHGIAFRQYDLTVLEPPRPVRPPSEVVTVTANSPVSLPCPVTGNPKPEVRWFYLGTNTLVPLGGRIRQSINNSLVLERVTAEDSRGYQCVATNDVGRTVINVTLNVKLAPVIDPFLLSEVIANATQVQLLLPCVATANPPATITWLKDFQPVRAGDPRRVVTEEGTLVVTLVEASDAGFYTCQAANEIGQASLSLRLTVQVPPSLDQTPQDQAIIVGGNVAFTCKASGIPQPVVSWSTRGQPLGIVSDILTLENVQARRDSGDYTCRATNLLGVVEATANLNVLVPPNIDVVGDVQVEEPVAGGHILLPCPATGNPPPTVFWMRDNEIISPNSQRYRIFPNGSLRIPNLSDADRGVYICRINSSVGQDEIRYDLNVKVHPEFIRRPANTTTRVGSTTWMHCSASGSPAATVTWLKDGERLQVESAARLRQASNGSLQIINVLASDQGQYTCLVANELGTLTGDGHLTVQVRPRITPPAGPGQNPTTQQGDAILLDCPSRGNPPPVIIWQQDGDLIVEDPSRHLMFQNGSLLLFNPTGEDSGRYTCRALNQLGEDEISYVLTVNVKPAMVLCPADVVAALGRSARFDCSATGRPTPAIYWTSAGGFDSRSSRSPYYVVLRNNSLVVNAVSPPQADRYTCHAGNVLGEVVCGANLTVQVPPVIEYPPAPITTIDEDSPIILPCISHGLPPPTITWYKGGQPLVADGVRVAILDNGQRLRIARARGEDTANYECRAKNKLGEVVQSFQLTIQVAPTINLVPQDQTVEQSDTAVLHCAATGRPNPRLKWFKSVTDGLFPVLRTAHISLLRNGSLVIVDTQPTHAGVYICVAENVLGEDRQSALLTVRVLPRIHEPDVPRPTVNAGGSITIPCSAQGNPRPQIRWLKDGNVVAFSARIQQTASGALVINDVRPSDDGDYRCIASNPVGDVTIDIPLVVKVAPTFTQPPQNTTSKLGSATWLHCAASGQPPPDVKWLRNGQPLQADSHVQLLSNNTLYIQFVESGDDAMYTCVTTNDLGENRQTIRLNVEREPAISPPGADPTTTFIGNDTTLVCEFQSNPRPQVYWVHNGRTLVTNGRYNVTTVGNRLVLQISGTVQEDAGDYVCKARNRHGETERIFKLDVNTPSDILQPEDASLDVGLGRPLVLSCVVSGFPPPMITWLKDGSPVTPSDRVVIQADNSLMLASVEETDGAQYSCVATNNINTDVLLYDLRVLVPPSIVLGPQDHTASPNEAVDFYCVARGVPEPAVLWIHDDIEITQDRAARDGFALRQDGTLSVASVSQHHAGRYQCVVINSQGQARASATLTVLSPPVLVTRPTNQEATIGGDAVFHCVANGLPIPTISWERDGNVLEEMAGIVSVRGGYLQLRGVQRGMAGVYVCVATNRVTSVRANATLTVHVAPTIAEGDTDITINEGEDLVIHCETQGTPHPAVSWLRGDRPLTSARHLRFPNNTLVIKGARAADSGQYNCIATNLVGSTTHSTSVRIQVPPRIEDMSEMPDVIEGDVAILPCNAYGDPLPSVTWFNQDARVETGGRYFMRRDNSLEIHGADRADSGVYVCLAENPAGAYTMDVALDVKELPRILLDKKPDPRSVPRGGNIVLQCPVSGHPKPSVAWVYGNQLIQFGADGISTGDANLALHSDGSLLIANAAAEHSGTFECVASNEFGRARHEFLLVIQTKPEIKCPGTTNITLQQGQYLRLTYTVRGEPEPYVGCLVDGVPVEQTPLAARSTYTRSGPLVTWTVFSVLLSDAGKFTFEATNTQGSSQCEVQVYVCAAPVIQNPQADVTLVPGTMAALSCEAVGCSPLEVSWYKNDETVANIPSSKYSVGGDGTLSIDPVDMQDSGVYRCEVSNSVNRVENSFSVFVLVHPDIETQPETLVAISGETIWLHCVTTGNPSPTLTWERNGVLLVTAGRQRVYGNGTLRVDDVQVGDEGDYECVARNPAGFDTVSHSVDVVSPPRLLPPLPITPCLNLLVGNTAVFQCRVAGRPSPRITWRKAPSADIIATGGRYSVAVSRLSQRGSLQIVNVVPGDGGNYTCSAANAAGTVEQTYALCVQERPSIVASFLDWTGIAGERAALRCDVKGTPRPRIAWIKDGRAVVASSRARMALDAVQSATLTFRATRVSDGGAYTCTATNNAGSASATGTLTVQVAPMFKIVPFDTDPVVGSSIVLPCAAKGVPKPLVKWTYNGHILPGGSPRFSIINGGSLSISRIRSDDAGPYVCSAVNSAGSITATGQVTVLVAPRIVQGPVDTWVRLGNTLSLTCSARGSPTPTLTWLHNGRPMQFVEGSTNERVLAAGTLHIQRVSASHTGVYMCRYNNSAGATTRRARVNVQFAPSIASSSGDLYALPGANIVLRCAGQGSPPPAMCWIKDGQLVISEGSTFLLEDGGLLVSNVGQEQTGVYTCKATNWLGTASEDSQVVVLTTPPDQSAPVPPNTVAGTIPGRPLLPNSEYQPEEVRVSRGSPAAELPCLPTSSLPNAVWMRNGSRLSVTDSRFQVTASGSLLLGNPTIQDRGVYVCSGVADDGTPVPVNAVHVVFTDDSDEPIEIVGDVYPFVPALVPDDVAGEVGGTDGQGTVGGGEDGGTQPVSPSAGSPQNPTVPTTTALRTGATAGTPTANVLCGHQVDLDCGSQLQGAVWSKDGVPLMASNDLEISSRGALIIPEAAVSDSGLYQCHRGDSIVTMVQMNVQASAPTIRSHLSSGDTSVFVRVEDSITLNCEIVSCSPATRLWLHSGQVMQAVPGKVELLPNGSLVLRNLQRSERGRYNCRATNRDGTTDSEGVQLRVSVPPTIDQHPVFSVSDVRDNVLLDCVVSGRPRPVVFWTRDDVVVDVDAQPRYELFGNGTLLIRRVTLADQGIYRCNASAGPFSIDSKPATVYVNDPRAPAVSVGDFGTPGIRIAVDGGFRQWAAFSPCSATCGGGYQIRRRACDSPLPQYGGRQCSGAVLENQTCALSACPVDGAWSGYTVQQACSQTCSDDGGSQVELRFCNAPAPQNGGRTCQGDPIRVTPCGLPPCNVDGGWTDFGAWTCSVACGAGTRRRSRTCTRPAPAGTGASCAGSADETGRCSLAPCPNGDQWTDRGSFTAALRSGSAEFNSRENIALDMSTGRRIRIAIPGVTAATYRQLQYLTSQLLMPFVWLRSQVQPPALNGDGMHGGHATHSMLMRFDTGDLVALNTTISTDGNAALRVAIAVAGSVPQGSGSLTVAGFSGDEVHARMSASQWAFISDRGRYRLSNGNSVGVQWSQRMQCQKADGSPATCKQLAVRQQVFGITRQMSSSYDPSTGLFIATSPLNSRIFPVPGAPCPAGLVVSGDQQYCLDGDSCRGKLCTPPSTCHDALALSYCT